MILKQNENFLMYVDDVVQVRKVFLSDNMFRWYWCYVMHDVYIIYMLLYMLCCFILTMKYYIFIREVLEVPQLIYKVKESCTHIFNFIQKKYLSWDFPILIHTHTQPYDASYSTNNV